MRGYEEALRRSSRQTDQTIALAQEFRNMARETIDNYNLLMNKCNLLIEENNRLKQKLKDVGK